MNGRRLLNCVVVAQTLLAGGAPVSAQTPPGRADITPTDVFGEVFAVAHDIEQIRFYMGRPRNGQEAIGVTGVAPREVIYQAATLCEKTNRLSQELIREIGEKPAVPDKDVVPGDVFRMVELAHDRVRRIAEGLGLELTPAPTAPAGEKTPTDVYRAVVQLNRQINILLDQRFSPADVYQQVSLAIAHAANVRGRWPGQRIPPEPAWELGRRPPDVYRRLLGCFDMVRRIAADEDLQVLELSVSDGSMGEATPSDVYDIASLLVSDLAYVDRVLNGSPPERKSWYPGRKVPSDVFQRVGILETQLIQIVGLAGGGTGQGGT